MAKKSLKNNPLGDTWTPGNLLSALRRAHKADRVDAMKASGVLTRHGKLSKRYRSWGKRVAVTEVPAK